LLSTQRDEWKGEDKGEADNSVLEVISSDKGDQTLTVMFLLDRLRRVKEEQTGQT
jgi:hypothetical protein